MTNNRVYRKKSWFLNQNIYILTSWYVIKLKIRYVLFYIQVMKVLRVTLRGSGANAFILHHRLTRQDLAILVDVTYLLW